METFARKVRSDASGSSPLPTPRVDTAPTAWASLAWMVRSSRALHPERTLADLSQAAQLFLRQWLLRHELRRWHLPEPSPLQDALAWRPSLVSVVRRPYISTAWSATRRVAAVEQHYRQLTGQGRSLHLEPEGAVRLASVGARDSTVEVVLDTPPWFIHEGEICLNLFHRGDRVYTLAFSLGFDGADPVAYVGALQGSGNDGALGLYRALTHALHGLRPRDLLIAAFRIVCRELGATRWLAVGDRHRVSGSDYFGATARVYTRYDACWADHGGHLRPDGFHDMPVHLARRSTAEIPSRKRSAYRQRYEMLDRLEVELARAIRSRGAP